MLHSVPHLLLISGAACLLAVCTFWFAAPHTASAAPRLASITPHTGSILTATLPFSRALDLSNSTAAYVQAGDGTTFNIDPAGTQIDFWLEVPDTFTGRTSIVHKPNAYEFALVATQDGLSLLFTERIRADISSPITPGWHYVSAQVCVSDLKKTTFLNIDGETVGGGTSTPWGVPQSASPLRLLQGERLRIDELRFATAESCLRGTGFTPPSPYGCGDDTWALWHFDEGPGASAYRSACQDASELAPAYSLLLPLAAQRP